MVDKKLVVTLVVFAALVIAGCSGADRGAKIKAFDLMNSSLDKYDEAIALWDEDDFTGARIKIESAKSDLKECKSYLENSNLDPDKKQSILKACDGLSYLCDWAADMSNFLENFVQGTSRIRKGDYDGAITKLYDAKEDLNEAEYYFNAAREKYDSINMENLPSNQKSGLIETKAAFREYEDFHKDYNKLCDILIAHSQGLKDFQKAAEYTDQEEWVNAENEFNDALTSFREAEESSEKLRNCDTPEVASMAVNMYIVSSNCADATSHYINASTPNITDMLALAESLMRGQEF